MRDTKLNDFLGKVVTDVGAAMSAALVLIGDELGLWRALADSGEPLTPGELARRTGTTERYLHEWLDAMAAGGYVTYSAGAYHLEPEQAGVLADQFVPGLFQVTAAMWAARAKIGANFRSGAGLSWGHQHPYLFEGTERFFRSEYREYLVEKWLPALDGVLPKLEAGITVADVGCGVGASTIIMAAAFPKSTFVGFDTHPGSIELARRRAREAGVEVTFEVAAATEFAGRYDLLATFDSLGYFEDPAAAAQHMRSACADNGTWLVVEPFAGDRPEENYNPIGRVFYSTSTMLCVPHSQSALGAQAGEARLRDLVLAAGWQGLRRATATPFNLVLEARP